MHKSYQKITEALRPIVDSVPQGVRRGSLKPKTEAAGDGSGPFCESQRRIKPAKSLLWTFLRPIPLVGAIIVLLEFVDKDFIFGKSRYLCEHAYLLSSWAYLQ